MSSKHIIINNMSEHNEETRYRWEREDEYQKVPNEAQSYAKARFGKLKPLPMWKKAIFLIAVVPLGIIMLPFVLFYGWRASKNSYNG